MRRSAILLASLAAMAFTAACHAPRESLAVPLATTGPATRACAAPRGYPYVVTLPRAPQPRPPVLLFLHGSGELGTDLGKVLKHGPTLYAATRADFPFLIVSPQTPVDAWDARKVLATLDDVLARYEVDRDRIYLTGLSLGGDGTYAVGALAADRFAALMPICGEPKLADAPRLRDLPIWVFHGDSDEYVDPAKDWAMVDALRRLHARVRYTLYPDTKHNAWTKTYGNPRVYEWLLAQRRGRPVQFRAENAGTQPSSTRPY